jgi:2-C-methyl-D-erythritol 4-phosphate cytidylyltransferase
LIIPREDQTKVNEILKRENIYNQTELAFGGQTREESVNNAISALEASHPEYDPLTTHVFIHDADRPFLTSALLGRLKEASLTHQAVIPGIRLIDSLYNQEANRYEDRKKFTSIQTPQVFSLGLIEEAFKKAQDSTVQFGDEGSIVKYSGEDLFFVEGDAGNIKVSDEESLIFAQMQARFHGE